MEKTFSSGLATPEGVTRFHTLQFLVVEPRGNGWTGYADLQFYTRGEDPNYATCLSPQGVQQLLVYLQGVVAAMPKPPELTFPVVGGVVPGTITYGAKTKVYFGQTYSLPVIQAMGVLMIRANLVDQQLIALNSALTGASMEQSTNQYYSSVNMKARLDAIRSIAEVSSLPEHLPPQIIKALDRVQAAANRRNDLVHARWTFRKGKHRALVHKPNKKERVTEITVTEKFVLEIVDQYATAHALLLACGTSVLSERKAASSTAATPSSTEPSS